MNRIVSPNSALSLETLTLAFGSHASQEFKRMDRETGAEVFLTLAVRSIVGRTIFSFLSAMVGKLGRVDDNFEDWMDPCMEARTRRLLPSIKEVSAHCKISATAIRSKVGRLGK